MNKEDITDYNSFVQFLDGLLGEKYDYTYNYMDRGHKKTKVEAFVKEWSGGGHGDTHSYTGKECSPSVYEPEPEPEAWELDTALEALAPNISFIQYRVLMGNCTTNSKSQGGYYGDVSITMYKKLSYLDLYNFLVGRDLL